ncbi:transposase [Streptomyces sp. NPDC051940]|uniref:transposase n=1 Tax=Streptomyces sp. NPDC051940 TaxID=3155675 RepID=UPI0034461FE4
MAGQASRHLIHLIHASRPDSACPAPPESRPGAPARPAPGRCRPHLRRPALCALQDFADLLDAARVQLGGNIVLVWDNATQHVDARASGGRERWLTVFRLPPYAPDLNPAVGIWAHLKNDLGHLAACTIDTLADLARTRLKTMQYRPDLLDGFIAETGLTLTRECLDLGSSKIFVGVDRSGDRSW